ncbi:MAG: hypothetical protein KJO97_00070 [Acidimicrobiia bacterium]|nr:hypothetical protein [Acidimicrobiia bacterium]
MAASATGCLGSQDPTLMSDRGACLDCIRLTDEITMGAEVEGALAGESRYVTVDSEGRYWISQGDRIEIFDERGFHLRTFGGPGQGPEEFNTVLMMSPTPSGNIVLFDGPNRRASVVSTDFEFLRAFTIDGPAYDLAFLSDEALVTNQLISTSDAFGFPIHMYAFSTGEKLQSFAKPEGVNRYPARGNPMRRAIEARTSGSILAAPRTSPTLEEWSVFGGRKLASWTRELEWFEPYEGYRPYTLEEPPQPMLDGLHLDENGHAWVLFWVAAEDWRDHLELRPFAGEMRVQSYGNGPIYDTVIEVWDLEAGRVLASTRVSETVHGFLPNGRLYGVDNLDDGTPLTRSWGVVTSY